jgi:mRNA interferase MazF
MSQGGDLRSGASSVSFHRWRNSVVRGDVHSIKLPQKRGQVQHGPRYAVLVQTDDLLALSTVVVCPTSSSTPPASFHPEILLEDQSTRVLCEMVGVVDVTRLGDQVGHLSLNELRSVDDALSLVLDLS